MTSLLPHQLSDGILACSEGAKTIVTAFTRFSIIYGYALDGALKWQSRLIDFKPMQMTQVTDDQGRKAILYGADPDYYDVIASMLALPGGYVLLQTARSTPASLDARREYAELDTYLISATSGEGIYVGRSVPQIHAIVGDRILTGVNDPFPQVKIYRLPGVS